MDLNRLNEPQREAVLHTEGPLLVLAGAGSGKTRVLTYRIAHLVEDLGVSPYNILAITFTNKAAGEMKQRVVDLVGKGDSVWVSTFHSACTRILRRFVDRLGRYDSHFSIYDADDAKSVIKQVCKDISINTKDVKESVIYGAISSAKNRGISPEQFSEEAESRTYREIARAYVEYQKRLVSNNAMDFDDILLVTVELLEDDPEVLNYYQERFQYIHVDEYQDTNLVQFRLVQLLAGDRQNLCVVGDDDQSIYKFRGADITNILSFEEHYRNARVIRLEQNYRSTQNILSAANSVIKNNVGRKQKTLWTDRGDGDKIRLRQLDSANDEGDFISDDIRRRVRNAKEAYREFAVLYRTNAQSRIIEEKFVLRGIPYRIVGGVNFYARREIKDILAYLKTVNNGADDVALRRIINTPRRGIGAVTINRAAEYAESKAISLFDAMAAAGEIPGMGKGGEKLENFTVMIKGFRASLPYKNVEEIIKEVIDTTGYVRELEESGEEDAADRIENIGELINKAHLYDETAGDEGSLSEFLEEVSLVADIDEADMTMDRVVLMTFHGAKGLEFPHVFMAGMEDGLFPSYRSITSDDPDDIEEERRLAYVGITRAMRDLTLTSARTRMVNGETKYNTLSRYAQEIPRELYDEEGAAIIRRLGRGSSDLEGEIFRRNLFERDSDTEGRGAGFGGSYGGGFGSGFGGGFGGGSAGSAPAGSGTGVIKKQKPRAAAGTSEIHKPYIARQVSSGNALMKGAALSSGNLDYAVGDRVSHIKFGDGTVLEIEETPKDHKVKVDFDAGGVKIMYAAFAKLKKI